MEGERALTENDVSSLLLRICVVDRVSEIAGTEITRPVLIFYDREQYFRFTKKIFGNEGSSALFLRFTYKNNPDHPLTKTGLIFASKEDPEELAHEMRHSIDPHQPRVGYDGIIEESFAFFQAYGENLPLFNKILKGYYDQFSKRLLPEQIISTEKFGELVDLFTSHLQTLKTKYQSLELQRQIVQCKTLRDFLSL